MTLREVLAGLPANSLVPAGWVLEQLPAEASVPAAPEAGALLTVPQLADLLHRSRSTVRCWVERGEFTGAAKVGRGWLVPAAAVSAFIERARATSPTSRTITTSGTSPTLPRRSRASGAPGVDLGAWRKAKA